MINIDELRQRVEAAEQRFGLIDSSQRKSSERLIGMMNAIEQDKAQKQLQLEENTVLIGDMAKENQQLRGMLQSLLLVIEAGSSDQSTEIMRQMDRKLTAIVGTAKMAPTDEPAKDAVAQGALAVEVVAAREVDEEPIGDDRLPEPPGVLPTAVGVSTVPAVGEVGEDSGEAGASEGASGVREILQRMNQEKRQKEVVSAASSRP